MKKKLIIAAAVAIVLFVIYQLFVGSYNKMVEMDENVKEKWAQVENAYQRRNDLIPNLVNTVKGYADFEKSTLTDVVKARASATGVKIEANDLSAENIAKFQQAQDGLSTALSRLLVSVERYPDLKANENFRDLQTQLEGTENRIGIQRKNFNEAVKDYNLMVRTFPNNLFAGLFGFSQKGYFRSVVGAEGPPDVKF
ncbi:MAG: LemA family protein [Bacteroidota bacterium]|jgi:LemA protein